MNRRLAAVLAIAGFASPFVPLSPSFGDARLPTARLPTAERGSMDSTSSSSTRGVSTLAIRGPLGALSFAGRDTRSGRSNGWRFVRNQRERRRDIRRGGR